MHRCNWIDDPLGLKTFRPFRKSRNFRTGVRVGGMAGLRTNFDENFRFSPKIVVLFFVFFFEGPLRFSFFCFSSLLFFEKFSPDFFFIFFSFIDWLSSFLPLSSLIIRRPRFHGNGCRYVENVDEARGCVRDLVVELFSKPSLSLLHRECGGVWPGVYFITMTSGTVSTKNLPLPKYIYIVLSLPHTHTNIYTYIHTDKHTHTHNLSYTLSLSLFLSYSQSLSLAPSHFHPNLGQKKFWRGGAAKVGKNDLRKVAKTGAGEGRRRPKLFFCFG